MLSIEYTHDVNEQKSSKTAEKLNLYWFSFDRSRGGFLFGDIEYDIWKLNAVPTHCYPNNFLSGSFQSGSETERNNKKAYTQ